jgi:hypothetical protein
MNAEDVLRDWLARRRSASPTEDLTDRIMAALPAESVAVPADDPSSHRQYRPSRIWSGILAGAATLVLGLRIYSALSVIATPVAMDADDVELQQVNELRKGNDERRLASRT